MILITGATGKSGSATARALNNLGQSYRALIRNPEKEENLKPWVQKLLLVLLKTTNH